MLTFRFSGAEGVMAPEDEILTAGMVGKEVKLEFSEDWDGLSKIVVFSNGSVTADVVCTGEMVVIPAKILEKPLKRLTVGVYGVSGDGKLVIPTVRAEGPVIKPGVDPSGDPATDPELPIWAQIQGLIGDMGDLETEDTSTLVAAINELTVTGGGATGENGATFIPEVDEYGELSWTNDKGLPNPDPVRLMGPQGEKGDTGEQGPQGEQGIQGEAGPQGQRGYALFSTPESSPVDENVGSETEFVLSEIRLSEGLTLMPGDFILMESGGYLLSVTSVDEASDLAVGAYLAAFSGTGTTDEHINELIDAKLGVIENGTY